MMTTALQDNIPLLDKMMADLKFAEDVYKPSAFWCDSMTETARALRRYGLKGFRSNRKATPGLTWTDAPNLSVCDYTYKFPRTVKGKLVQVAFRTNIFRKLLDVLDRTVRSGAEATYFTYYKFYRDYWVNAECYHWFSEVLKDHSIPNCMVGEPIDCIRICNQLVSPAYLGTLARICNFNDDTDFKKFRTMFIIGGGFGYEVHLIMSLFPNIKKCITLDMPPNLYVQTQYLKAVMKEGCIDYLETCRLDKIGFSRGDDEVEIIAIAPWQIENVDASFDLLWNSCSFQEMTVAQVRNYALFSERLMARSADPEICLTMYSMEAPTSRAEILEAFKGFSFGQVPASRKFWPIPPYEEFHYIGRKPGSTARTGQLYTEGAKCP